MSLILLKPNLLSFKNSLVNRKYLSHQNLRDVIIFSLAISIMYMIYKGALWSINHFNANPELLYLPPRYPLSMILTLLFFMLVISGIAVSIGTLFLAQDLDLILASPISKFKIFSNKLIYITVNSSWMPVIFIFPLLVAFKEAYKADYSFYFISLVILLPFFLLANGISCFIAIILSRIIPANRSREMLFLAAAALLSLIYLMIDLIRLGITSTEDRQSVSRIVSFLSLADNSWMPSNWAAICLQDFILKRNQDWPGYLPLLLLSALAFISLAHIIFYLFYFDSYASSRNIKRIKNYKDSNTRGTLAFLGKILTPPERALVKKEILHFSRDVTHIIQLVMLLGLCAIYILNLKIFLNINSFPEESRGWWQKFFFICNSSIAAFVTTGFCTRFVYVSLSLEGKSLWILHSAPPSLKEILLAKFKSWYLPVSVLGCIVFCASGFSLGISSKVLILSIFAGLSICYGIVGLAIGLGARFANFNWEHSSQLSAGFGNMVFMISSILLIAANLIPACVMLFARPDKLINLGNPDLSLYLTIIAMFTVIIMINISVKKMAINFGVKNLEKELS